MTLMQGNDWNIARKLAAELITEHSMDLNMLQGVMLFVKAHQTNRETLYTWLDNQVKAAQFFPRSNQTISYSMVTRSLIEYLCDEYNESLQNDPDHLAELLGWIIRRMYFYRNNHSSARQAVGNRPILFVPEPPRYVLQSFGSRLGSHGQGMYDLPEVPESEDDVSDLAKDFFNQFFGGDDEDAD